MEKYSIRQPYPHENPFESQFGYVILYGRNGVGFAAFPIGYHGTQKEWRAAADEALTKNGFKRVNDWEARVVYATEM